MTENRLKVILVPHEPTLPHTLEIENQLARLGVTCVRYSQSEAPDPTRNQVLLVDQVGILAELYAWADLAFVGGSFGRGVHSVMEALAAGLPVVVGPWHLNNQEAIEFQEFKLSEKLNAVTCASDQTDLVQWLTDAVPLLESSDFRNRICEAITARAGASERVAEAILTAARITMEV